MKLPWLLVISLPILTSSVRADEFDNHVSDVALLQVKAVQKEVGISDAQRARLNVHAGAHKSKLVAYETKLKAEMQRSKKQIQLDQKVLMGYFSTLRSAIIKELKPAQTKRLRELTLQRSGLVGILDQKVAAKVGVSNSQLEKMRSAYVAGAKQVAEIEQKALNKILVQYKDKKPKDQTEANKLQKEAGQKIESERRSIQPTVVRIQNGTRDKMLAVMTESQKNAYKVLQGKTFDWSKA